MAVHSEKPLISKSECFWVCIMYFVDGSVTLNKERLLCQPNNLLGNALVAISGVDWQRLRLSLCHVTDQETSTYCVAP